MAVFSKKKVAVGALVAVILIIAGAVFFGRTKKTKYEFVEAKKGDLVQEISVTGKTVSIFVRDLSFVRGGKISEVNVAVRDRVQSGQILAKLDKDELVAELVQAQAIVDRSRGELEQLQAALEREQARLSNVQAGSRFEEIDVAQAQLDSALFGASDAQLNFTIISNRAAPICKRFMMMSAMF